MDKVGDQVDRFHIRYQIDKEIFKGYNMISVFGLYNESKDTVVSKIRFYFQELEPFAGDELDLNMDYLYHFLHIEALTLDKQPHFHI